MSNEGAKLVKYERQKEKRRKQLPLEERKALSNLRREAREKGVPLTTNGRGGLPPSLVLGVMRRDQFQCKIHGDHGEGENGGLGVHHKGGIVASTWLSNKGHRNELNNLVTLCARAHDEIHDRARDDGNDSSQVEAKGDAGA